MHADTVLGELKNAVAPTVTELLHFSEAHNLSISVDVVVYYSDTIPSFHFDSALVRWVAGLPSVLDIDLIQSVNPV